MLIRCCILVFVCKCLNLWNYFTRALHCRKETSVVFQGKLFRIPQWEDWGNPEGPAVYVVWTEKQQLKEEKTKSFSSKSQNRRSSLADWPKTARLDTDNREEAGVTTKEEESIRCGSVVAAVRQVDDRKRYDGQSRRCGKASWKLANQCRRSSARPNRQRGKWFDFFHCFQATLLAAFSCSQGWRGLMDLSCL